MIQLSGQIQTSSNKSKSLDSNHFIHGYSNDDNFQIPMRFRTSSLINLIILFNLEDSSPSLLPTSKASR